MTPKATGWLDALKLLALIAMTVDHVNTALLGRACEIMTLVGRVAFPVFVVAAAFGALRTRAPVRYLRRLFLCAAAAQPFFWLALGGPWWYLNTVFTLFWGVAAVLALRFRRYWLVPLLVLPAVVSDYAIAGATAVLAGALLLSGSPLVKVLGGLVFLTLGPLLWSTPAYRIVGFAASGAAFLLWTYASGRTSPAGARYGFYVFYPLHLAALAALAGLRQLLL